MLAHHQRAVSASLIVNWANLFGLGRKEDLGFYLIFVLNLGFLGLNFTSKLGRLISNEFGGLVAPQKSFLLHLNNY